MPVHSVDEQHLQRALELARQGIGLASPNPYVGALITDAHGNIVGTGTYTYDGVKHAEVHALEQAGEKARGGTLYINLEPCSHQGRTPPCADAVVAAGIQRVVAAMADPNPQVNGRGFEKLHAAGVKVEVGLLEEQARRLNEAFARYIRHSVPLVTLKSGMTLDGKIAPPPAKALNRTEAPAAERGFTGNWITGDAARAHVHELRHQHDAILVGVGTILADDPLLTDRSGRPRRRRLQRVILDSRLRIPLDSRLVVDAANSKQNDVLVFCSSGDAQKKSQLEDFGIRVEQVPHNQNGRSDLHAVLRRLGEIEIISVMIEGGSTINGAALEAGIVDKVFLYYAPKILAGTDAIPFATGADLKRMTEAVQVKCMQFHRFGEDFAVEGYLRNPFEE